MRGHQDAKAFVASSRSVCAGESWWLNGPAGAARVPVSVCLASEVGFGKCRLPCISIYFSVKLTVS